MAIDLKNPLLNGPRRVDARPVMRVLPLVEPLVEPAETAFPQAAAQPARAPVSEEQIMAARSLRGAWTRETLAGWGVAWPPPQGWKQRLLNGEPQLPSNRPDAPGARAARPENGQLGLGY